MGGTHIGIIQEPSVEKLAAAISTGLSKAASHNHPRKQQSHSPLLTLHKGLDDGTPVFCFPGAGASVTSFLAFAEEMGDQTTVHGLQPRGLDNQFVPHAGIPAAARSYVRAIRDVWPSGPFRLVGHSFGGWIACEVASQLIAGGSTVDSVILLDTDSPDAGARNERLTGVDVFLKFVEILELECEQPFLLAAKDFEGVAYDGQLELLLRKMISAGLLHRRCTIDVIRGVLRVFAANLNMPYLPATPFPSRLLLVQAGEGLLHESTEEQKTQNRKIATAWNKYAAEVLTLEIAGNHMSILKRPRIGEVAKSIRRCWQQDQLADGLSANATADALRRNEG